MIRFTRGTIKLTRFREYFFTILAVTLLSAKLAGGKFSIDLAIVLIANLLSVAFAFMFNDVEDALEDAEDEHKRQRNPVANGDLSYIAALFLSFAVACLAMLFYYISGIGPFAVGLINLVIAFAYSWRRVRLKSKPLLDVLAHIFLLAGAQFICTYLVFNNDFMRIWPILLPIFAMSAYGELWNELRDFRLDEKTNINHSAAWFGYRRTKLVMLFLLAISIACMIYALLTGLVPILVAIAVLSVGGFYTLMMLTQRQEAFVKTTDKVNLYIFVIISVALAIWFFN